jgi:hypothetical protein
MKIRLVSLVALVTALGTAAGCSQATDPNASDLKQFVAGTVSARLNAGKLEIHNGTPSAQTFAVIERHFFEHALVSWCMGSDDCGEAIAPGETRTIPVTEVQYYNSSASEAIVFWWPRPAPPPSGSSVVQQFVVAIR